MGLLSKNEYKFVNISDIELESGETFYFYGDNLQEAMHLVFWLEKYNPELVSIKRGYQGISKYICIYKIEDKQFNFIMLSYYHNGEIPKKVRQLINKIDKPDVVIYCKKTESIICGIENTETCFAGDATWQRHGRIMNFIKNDFPFVFFAYYSKKDASQNSIRKPSPLFVLSFFALSILNSIPTIVSLYEHEDVSQNLKNSDDSDTIDTRISSLKYILSLIQFGPKDSRTEKALKSCFFDMKYYYKKEIGRVQDSELPSYTLNLLRASQFEDDVVRCINNKDTNYPLFSIDTLKKWGLVTKKEFPLNKELVGFKDYITTKLPNVSFYQPCPKCPVGITFDTKTLISDLEIISKRKDHFWEDALENDSIPTIFIPLRLTKNSKLQLPDPYNGRIPAFYELYKQSFGEINCLICLIDHSNKNEYNPDFAKEMKIFKSIDRYANLLIDRDFNIIDKSYKKTNKDARSKFKESITEDNVTCFFETILKSENITPSFINPPCGSWSDLKLYPTNKFLYLKRDYDRPDIAYYIGKNKSVFCSKGTYYVGESKSNFKPFDDIDKYNKEIDRIEKLIEIIKNAIDLDLTYETFIIFYGTESESVILLNDIQSGIRRKVNYIVIIEEQDVLTETIDYNIRLLVKEVNYEVSRK